MQFRQNLLRSRHEPQTLSSDFATAMVIIVSVLLTF